MSGEAFPVRQERDDAPAMAILRVAAIGVAVGTAGVLLASALLVATAGSVRPGGARAGARRVAPNPVEQTPLRDVQHGMDLADAQRRSLEGWGWVDRRAGLAKIPIEQAMDLVVEASP
jgi:hypothetical protein